MKKLRWVGLVVLCQMISIAPVRAAAELQVGIADIDTQPEIGVPLAGYGSKSRRLKGFIDWKNKHKNSTFFKPSEGVHTPIRSKVMVLRKGGKHVVFISLDVIGVEYRFLKDVAKKFTKYAIDEEDFFISGTHTHSGPGTLSKRIPLELVAVDLFKKKNYKRMLNKVVESVELAISRLEPADLFSSRVEINGVQRNKFRRKEEEYYNKEAKFLVARSKQSGTWLGGLVNFAVHGGGLPHDLMLFSSDFPGQIEINLEKILAAKNGTHLYKPVFLFMNGAEGDVGVKNDPIDGESIENIEKLGRLFGEQAASALDESALKPVTPEISIKRKHVRLGLTAGSSIKWCVGGMFKRLPATWRIPYFALYPTRAYISQVKIGDIVMMTWPGEASSRLGWDLQDLALKKGAGDAWVLGLTNDYMTYFTTKSEFYEGAYDSCSSLFTYKGGERIVKAHKEML